MSVSSKHSQICLRIKIFAFGYMYIRGYAKKSYTNFAGDDSGHPNKMPISYEIRAPYFGLNLSEQDLHVRCPIWPDLIFQTWTCNIELWVWIRRSSVG